MAKEDALACAAASCARGVLDDAHRARSPDGHGINPDLALDPGAQRTPRRAGPAECIIQRAKRSEVCVETTPLIIVTAALLFLCAFIRSAVGFGDALLAIPFLGMIMSLSTASPVVAMAGFTMSLSILVANQETVDFQSAWRLIAASLVGIPFGVFLLHAAPERAVKCVLGLVLVVYGVYNLITPGVPHVQHEKYALPFGFLAGILGGAYNTSGPPVVIYGTLRRWSPEYFRATMQCYFFFTYLATIAGHGVARLWTPLVIKLFLWALPGIGLGIYLGGKVHRVIPKPLFSRVIFGILVLIGVLSWL